MNNLKIIFVLIAFLSAKYSTAQDSLTVKDSKAMILEIDALIHTTHKAIEDDDVRNKNKIQQAVKDLNAKNCQTLLNMSTVLQSRLVNDYGDIENIHFQIEPFITSLEKCIYSMQVLTTHDNYIEVEEINFETAFLFHELAKGNLFRVIGEQKNKPKLFSVSLSFGYHTNPFNAILTDAYKGTTWKNITGSAPDFTEQKANQNLFYALALDYKISAKATAGIGFQSLPSISANAQIFINDTVDLIDYASENVSGNAFNFHSAYVFKKLKPNGTGLELSAGGVIQLNNYLLEREINANILKYIYFPLYYGQIDTVSYDTTFSYNYISEKYSESHKLNSIAIGINITASFLLNKLFSINATLSQYVDTGVKVDELKFYSRNLPAYTLKLNSFTARVGIGLHF